MCVRVQVLKGAGIAEFLRLAFCSSVKYDYMRSHGIHETE